MHHNPRPRHLVTWTILIATLGRRQATFLRLIRTLAPQLQQANGAVRVMALWNNGERPLTRVRQDLIEYAETPYISFIDDDDIVTPRFIPAILPLLDGDVHHAGFRAMVYNNGIPWMPARISLDAGSWDDTGGEFLRDITIINPIRRDLVMKHADFTAGGWPEDRSWAAQLRGHLTTGAFADEILYHYYYNPADSIQTWPGQKPPPGDHARPHVNCPHFTWHPASTQHS